MSTQRKAKPARIKGAVTLGPVPVKTPDNLTVAFRYRPASLILPIDNPDALVEQVARALHGGSWTFDVGEDHSRECYYEDARAALRSIGVPIKGGKK
jgi:hypothetical protein